MGILGFLLLVVIVGVFCWLAIRYAPMPDEFKKFLPAAAIVILIILLLGLLGIFKYDYPIPQLR